MNLIHKTMVFTILHKIGNKSFQVHKIIETASYKRIFRVFDRDKPYELYIRYYEPENMPTTNIIFVPGFLGLANNKSTKDFYFRFKTKQECLSEKEKIDTKKTILQKEFDNFQKNIFDKYNLD